MTNASSRPRRLVTLAVAGVTGVGALLVAVSASAATSTTPPWQSATTPDKHDPNQLGTLAFYDSSGKQVYGGSTTDSSVAAYVVGSSAPRTGDTLASLYAYAPSSGSAPGAWTGSQLTAASAYPNTAAPGGVPAGPTVTGTATDSTLDGFVSTHVGDSAAGYSGIYELRLRTSTPGQAVTDGYDVADVKVTGSTWELVYPAPPVVKQDTTTTITATPGSVTVGGSVTLNATVSPAAAGTVTFKDGTTVLSPAATVDAGTGKASASYPVSTAGTHSYTATFTPTDTAAYGGSTSSAATVTAQPKPKATATVVGGWPTGALHYGTAFAVSATVSAAALTPTGTVTVKSGATALVTATLVAGKAKLTVPGTKLAPGSRPLTLVYNGSADVATASTAKTLVMGKAVATASSRLSPTTVRSTSRSKIAVTVTAPGTPATGSVSVYDGKTRIATGTLSSGRVTITLPVVKKVGKHSIVVKYAGSTLVAAANAKAVTLTVVK